MQISLSMTSTEFVTSTFDRIYKSQGQSSSNSDFENFSKILDDFPHIAKSFVELIRENPTTECVSLLAGLIDHWFICSVAEKFPKIASRLPNAEVQFQKLCKEYRSNVFMPKWKEEYQAVGIYNIMTKIMLGRLGEFFSTTSFPWNGLTWQLTMNVHLCHSRRSVWLVNMHTLLCIMWRVGLSQEHPKR